MSSENKTVEDDNSVDLKKHRKNTENVHEYVRNKIWAKLTHESTLADGSSQIHSIHVAIADRRKTGRLISKLHSRNFHVWDIDRHSHRNFEIIFRYFE